MSGETQANESGWTTDTLHDHVDRLLTEQARYYDERFRALERAVDAALSAADKASIKAEHSNEKRFEGVNEFRAQLNDQAQTFIPRNEAEARIRSNTEKLDLMQARIDKAEGIAKGGAQLYGYAIGAGGFVIGLTGIILALLK